MDSPSADRVTSRWDTKGGRRPEGFSLLEMMLVALLKLSALSHQLSAGTWGIGNGEPERGDRE